MAYCPPAEPLTTLGLRPAMEERGASLLYVLTSFARFSFEGSVGGQQTCSRTEGETS